MIVSAGTVTSKVADKARVGVGFFTDSLWVELPKSLATRLALSAGIGHQRIFAHTGEHSHWVLDGEAVDLLGTAVSSLSPARGGSGLQPKAGTWLVRSTFFLARSLPGSGVQCCRLLAVSIFDVLCFLWAGCAVVRQRGLSADAIVDFTDGKWLLQDKPSRCIYLCLSLGTDSETGLITEESRENFWKQILKLVRA